MRYRAWKTANSDEIHRLTIKTNSEIPLNILESKQQIDEYTDILLRGINRIVDQGIPWSKPLAKARSF